jgi:signal transduction histidine kinase/DNA-binding response OmpR family regulator
MTAPPNRRVLLVDDTRTIHDDFRKILDSRSLDENSDTDLEAAAAELFGDSVETGTPRSQFELDSAYQGQEAFEKVRAATADGRPYAMAFVDMRMPPGWDGFETIQNLWHVDPRLQMVICTAYSDQPWNEIFDKLEAGDRLLVLKKPFDNVEVAQLAHALTTKWEMTQRTEAKIDHLQASVQQRTEELQSTNDELQTLVTRFRTVLTTIPHLVWWKNDRLELAGCNDAYRRLTARGALDGEAAALPAVDRSQHPAAGDGASPTPGEARHPMLGEVITGAELEVSRTGSGVHDLRAHLAVPDDRTRVFLVSVLPNRSDGSSRTGVIGVATDVTDLSDLERQLSQATRLEAIGQLAAGVAHEINTPVQFVTDNVAFLSESFGRIVELIQALSPLTQGDLPNDQSAALHQLHRLAKSADLDFLSGEIPEAISQSVDGLRRVAEIVQAMKEFAHPGQERSDVDLNQAIETTVQASHSQWRHVAQVDLDLDPALGTVRCCEGELKQVLLNMIVNAAHALADSDDVPGSPDTGRITIGTRWHEGHVTVTIADNGSGMTEEIQQRIFDPFFTTKPVGKGTGQGLSTAHSIVVHKHGGTLDVTSVPGAGTTFTICLPLDGTSE